MTDDASAARISTACSGNNPASRRVIDIDRLSADDRCHFDLEDPTTAIPGPVSVSAAAPVSMAHREQFIDAEWVEPTDDLTGTAVFDATGDKAAMPSWDELVRQHADRVYRLAYRLSGNQHDAEDLTQETFIRVFRSVQNYQPGTFEGWLHRITTNLFLDMVRRRGRIRDGGAARGLRPGACRRAEPRADLPRLATGRRSAGRAGLAARRSSAPRWSCATSKVCPTRRSGRRSASSSAPCAAVSTVGGRPCVTTLRATPATPARPPPGTRPSPPDVPAMPHSMPRYIRSTSSGLGRPHDIGWRGAGWCSIPDMRSVELSPGFPRNLLRRVTRPSGPRQFGSTEHLSIEALAAFVDGELRMTAHLRAAHHLSLCPECALEVDAQRQAGRRCGIVGPWRCQVLCWACCPRSRTTLRRKPRRAG